MQTVDSNQKLLDTPSIITMAAVVNYPYKQY
jgi:hypothetical protein